MRVFLAHASDAGSARSALEGIVSGGLEVLQLPWVRAGCICVCGAGAVEMRGGKSLRLSGHNTICALTTDGLPANHLGANTELQGCGHS